MQVNLSSQGGFCTPSRTLESDRLSASAPPLTFAHLSDLHIHRFRPQHRRLCEAINERGVDFIFLTGDTLHHSPSGVRAAGRFLRGLRARRAVCACPGNGEARTFGRRSDFVELMGRWGVRALANRQVSFVTPAGPVTVAGLDDLIEGQPHVEAALPPRGGADFTVLLAHEPLAARLVPPERRPDLVLSGHTHGGQVRIPGLWRLMLPEAAGGFASGLYRFGGGHVHVSRGFGTSGLPVRLNCPPEVTFFTLRGRG